MPWLAVYNNFYSFDNIIILLTYFPHLLYFFVTSQMITVLSSEVESVPSLTQWGRDKMAPFFQTIFSNIFFWMKMFEFCLGFHWNLRWELTIFQHWFRQWPGADQTTSHYLNEWWLVYWRIYGSLGLNELRRLAGIQKQENIPWLKLILLWH